MVPHTVDPARLAPRCCPRHLFVPNPNGGNVLRCLRCESTCIEIPAQQCVPTGPYLR
jgi:hypothetical protein